MATPNIETQKQQPQIELEISSVEAIETAKKEFLKEGAAEKKTEILNGLLQPFMQKNYIIKLDVDSRYQLEPRPLPESAKPEEREKMLATLRKINEALRAMQARDATNNIPKDKDKKPLYDINDVFVDSFTDMLDNNSLVNDMLKNNTIDGKDLDAVKLMQNTSKLGALGKLLEVTKGAKGEDQKQRAAAITEIVQAIKDYKSTDNPLSGAFKAIGGFAESAGFSTVKTSSEIWDATKMLTGNLATKGGWGLVDSWPKITNILTFGLSMLVLQDDSNPLFLAIKSFLGANVAFGELFTNKDMFTSGFGALNNLMGGSAKAAEVDQKGPYGHNAPSKAPNAPTRKPLTAVQQKEQQDQQKMLDRFMGSDLSKEDIEALRASVNMPVSAVLMEAQPKMAETSVVGADGKETKIQKWDVEVNHQGAATDAIKNKGVNNMIYDVLSLIGKRNRSAFIVTTPDGNNLGDPQKRTDAYIGLQTLYGSFSKEMQAKVAQPVKDLVSYDNSFLAASMMLINPPRNLGTNAPDAEKRIAQAYTEIQKNRMTPSQIKSAFDKYERNPSAVNQEMQAAAPQALADTGTQETSPAASGQTDLERKTQQNFNRNKELTALQKDAYTDDQIDNMAGSFKEMAREYVRNTLQTVKSNILRGDTGAAAKLLQDLRDKGRAYKNNPMAMMATGGQIKDLEEGKAVNSFFVKLYMDQELQQQPYVGRVKQVYNEVVNS